MVDFFLVLMIAGGGDELQGIKKGVLELADAIAINKADGDNIERAKLAKRQYEMAFHLLTPQYLNWTPPVVTCSAITMAGLDDIHKIILDHHDKLTKSGELQLKRKEQDRDWLLFMVREGMQEWFYESPAAALMKEMQKEVEKGTTTPTTAAAKILGCLKGQKF
jgi:LAO/AO transport system kinase